MTEKHSPEKIVQLQLDYYNQQDVDGFVSTYTPDVLITEHPSGNVLVRGAEALRERYANMFAANPDNHAKLVNRITFGPFVIDLEEVSGRDQREPFQAVAIYEVRNQLISSVTFLEKGEE